MSEQLQAIILINFAVPLMVMRTSAQDSYLQFSSNESLTINYSYVTNLVLIGFINTAASPKLEPYSQLVASFYLENYAFECIPPLFTARS